MREPTVTVQTENGPVIANASDLFYVIDEDVPILDIDKPDDAKYIIAPNYKKQSVAWFKENLAIKDISFDHISKRADFLALYEMTHA